ncbi:MAG: hypothetical protein GY948_14530 [Alphaproteobacteria bacterium]|nr:hypothetical protein [Alphaproteobacteria bacterium]
MWSLILKFNLVDFAFQFVLVVISATGLIIVPSGVSLVTIMPAAIYAGQLFVQTHKRPPNQKEKWTFVLGAFASSACLSIILFGVMAISLPEIWSSASQLIQLLGLKWMMAIAVFVAMLQVGLLYICIGPMTTFVLRQSGAKPR